MAPKEKRSNEMNTVQLTGRLTADPEQSSKANGPTRFSVAVDRIGSDETDFFEVITWGKLASVVAEHLVKGRLVGVTGRLRQDRWETDAGERRSRVQVVADQVDFLDTKATKAKPKPEAGREPEPEPEEAF